MTRLKPIRLSPKAVDAPSELTVTLMGYEVHLGRTREGETYEEDRIFFMYNDTPMFTRLNNRSMMVLAHKGIICTIENLTKELVGLKIKLELQPESLPWYLITKVYKRAKKEEKEKAVA